MESLCTKSRVIILGDSLSMPRLEESISYENTYAYKLNESLADCDVICRSVRANDSRKQTLRQSLYDDIAVFNPDVVIVHLGIVDCAPRLFGKKQAFILSCLPKIIKTFFVWFFSINRKFFTKYRPKVYVKQKDFERNVNFLISEVRKFDSKVIFISIAATNQRNEQRSYGFSDNIKAYNEIIKAQCSRSDCVYLDFYSKTLNGKFLIDDGIHINEEGHNYLAGELNHILSCDKIKTN